MNAMGFVRSRQTRTAQVALAVLAVLLTLLYVVLPLLADEIGRAVDVPHLVLPYSIAACLAVAALHTVILALWKIVGFMRTGDFYARPVEFWVRIAKGAALLACVMPVLVLVHLVFFENAGSPLALPIAIGIAVLAVAGSSLLDLLVGLYRDASSHVAELSEVI